MLRLVSAAPASMPVSDFPALLARYMRRIRASAAGVASEIGMSREAVNNWRNGDALPNRKHRDKLLTCAAYLRLTEDETNRLLTAAGFEAEFSVESAAPVPTVARVLDQLQQLRPYPILLLLTQAHLGQPPQREAIWAQAQQRYGTNAVLHLQPPFSLASDAASYFSAIAALCGLDGVDSDYSFEAALARRLQSGTRLFCLVSRFEQGDPVQRDVLAGILRSLSEMYSGKLHLLICGGAALSDLKYRGGDLSLLNIAAASHWPDMQGDDLLAIARQRDLVLREPERALRLCGGHPLLAEPAIGLLAEKTARSDAELTELLAMHPRLWQALLPVLGEPQARAVIGDWLQRPRLSPARPYLLDPVLRALYWANLVVARQHDDGLWLEWRCDAIRVAARQIVEQLDVGRPDALR